MARAEASARCVVEQSVCLCAENAPTLWMDGNLWGMGDGVLAN